MLPKLVYLSIDGVIIIIINIAQLCSQNNCQDTHPNRLATKLGAIIPQNPPFSIILIALCFYNN